MRDASSPQAKRVTETLQELLYSGYDLEGGGLPVETHLVEQLAADRELTGKDKGILRFSANANLILPFIPAMSISDYYGLLSRIFSGDVMDAIASSYTKLCAASEKTEHLLLRAYLSPGTVPTDAPLTKEELAELAEASPKEYWIVRPNPSVLSQEMFMPDSLYGFAVAAMRAKALFTKEGAEAVQATYHKMLSGPLKGETLAFHTGKLSLLSEILEHVIVRMPPALDPDRFGEEYFEVSRRMPGTIEGLAGYYREQYAAVIPSANTLLDNARAALAVGDAAVKKEPA